MVSDLIIVVFDLLSILGVTALACLNLITSFPQISAYCRTSDYGVFKRGASPSFPNFPLSFQGEGDKGGEVNTTLNQYWLNIRNQR
jgi:hypothetical protein